MKISNVKFTVIAQFSDNSQKIKWCVTEKAVSAWANRQYRNDEDVIIYVYEGLYPNEKLVATYHA